MAEKFIICVMEEEKKAFGTTNNSGHATQASKPPSYFYVLFFVMKYNFLVVATFSFRWKFSSTTCQGKFRDYDRDKHWQAEHTSAAATVRKKRCLLSWAIARSLSKVICALVEHGFEVCNAQGDIMVWKQIYVSDDLQTTFNKWLTRKNSSVWLFHNIIKKPDCNTVLTSC